VKDYAIFMLTPAGRIASWNKGAQRLKGYSAEEAIGQHFSMFYPPDAVAAGWPDEELRRAQADGRFEDEGWRVRQDGTRFWANVVLTAVHGPQGELIGFSKVTRDLTERRQHEQRLKESEESLRLLVEGIRDHAMFLVGPQGEVKSWNLGASRMLGFEADDIVGKPLANIYTEEDRLAGKPQAELLSAKHAGFFAADGWRVKADGSMVWTHAALTALVDANGQLLGHVQILKDLSERLRVKELESEGQRLHQFIAMLSHELRNPLAPIRNAVEVLKNASRQPEISWCADMIGRQATHLTRLVEDLLDVSRITSGKIQIQPCTLDLSVLAQQASEAQRAVVEGLGHTLEVRVPPTPVMVSADATRLTQVIANLLSNAAKYTPVGGLIQLSLSSDQALATLQVTDSGIGMSEALMQRAFDPFVQGSRGLERSGGGLGIGLTLVKSVVEMHGGTVVLASAGAGRGTRITVTMPLCAAATPSQRVSAPEAAPALPASQASRGLVLLVDDNQDAAESLAEVLRISGHEVLLAHDGDQALALAAEHRPGTVLLDLGLPGMNGYEVARRLRGASGPGPRRLLALTGYGQESDKQATAEAGFDAHLVKPVDLDELLRLLDQDA
ncbi:MAG: PAS domain S-box protein, partial [Rubrivivax sp.]